MNGPPRLHSCAHCQKLVIDRRNLHSTPGDALLYRFKDGFWDTIYSIEELKEAYTEKCLLLRHIFDHCILPQTDSVSLADFGSDAHLCARVGREEAAISCSFFFYEDGNSEHLDLEFGHYTDDNYALFAMDGMTFWSAHLVVIRLTSVGDPATANVERRVSYRDANLEQMHHFLRSCLAGEGEHANCRNPSGDFVPGRLLRFEKAQDDTFQVTLTCPSKGTPYIALSYCWGGQQPHQLTRSRLSAYTEGGIPWSTIPKTIQDGIRVTETFGYSMIWVDSLCIVQDDEENMSQELTGMEQVYRSAVFTIVAACSDGAEKGFLADREEDFVCSLPFIAEDGTASSVYVLTNAFDPDPSDCRGWTMQESYLSRRLLRFGRLRTDFSCHTFRDDGKIEILCISDGWNPRLQADQVGPHLPPLSSLLDSSELRVLAGVGDVPDTTAQITTAPFEWMHVVREYTSRSLTLPSDRSVAIAGLAKFFAGSRNDTYIAGHWSNDLARELCWFSDPSGDEPQLPAGYAPSWSWMSVNMPVEFPHTETWRKEVRYEETISVLDFRYKLKDPNMPYGAVNYAHLKIRGRLGRGIVTEGGHVLVKTGSEDFICRDGDSTSIERWLTTPSGDNTGAPSPSEPEGTALAWLDLKSDHWKVFESFRTARPVHILLACQGVGEHQVALSLILSRSNVRAQDDAPTYWRGGVVVVKKGYESREYGLFEKYFSQITEQNFWLV